MATNSVILFPGSIFPSPYPYRELCFVSCSTTIANKAALQRQEIARVPSSSSVGWREKKNFPFSRGDVIEREGGRTQIRRGRTERLNIFTCMRFLFPRCDWPSSFVSSFHLFFFPATRREGDAPPLDGCFHPSSGGRDGENRLCPRAKPSSIYASIVETLRLFRISVCTCVRVCGNIYFFLSFFLLLFVSFCVPTGCMVTRIARTMFSSDSSPIMQDFKGNFLISSFVILDIKV